MTIVRPILAFVVALSLAVLPAAGGFAVAGHPTHSAMASTVDCDHHGMPHSSGHHGSPIDKAKSDCGNMAACSMHCFGIYGLVSSGPSLEVFAAATAPSFSPHGFLPQTNSPPFRPPRA